MDLQCYAALNDGAAKERKNSAPPKISSSPHSAKPSLIKTCKNNLAGFDTKSDLLDAEVERFLMKKSEKGKIKTDNERFAKNCRQA